MIASDVMTRKVITVTPQTTVTEIAELLLQNRISGVPVVDLERRMVGMVTEGDLLRVPTGHEAPAWWLYLLSNKLSLTAEEIGRVRNVPARAIMSVTVATLSEETPLNEIAAMLLEHNVKRLPVVRDGKLVGIVSRADLIEALTRGPRNIRGEMADEQC